MEVDLVKALTDLGGPIAVVVLFLWYLNKRDADMRVLAQSVINALSENSKALAHLDDSVSELKELFRQQGQAR